MGNQKFARRLARLRTPVPQVSRKCRASIAQVHATTCKYTLIRASYARAKRQRSHGPLCPVFSNSTLYSNRLDGAITAMYSLHISSVQMQLINVLHYIWDRKSYSNNFLYIHYIQRNCSVVCLSCATSVLAVQCLRLHWQWLCCFPTLADSWQLVRLIFVGISHFWGFLSRQKQFSQYIYLISNACTVLLSSQMCRCRFRALLKVAWHSSNMIVT
jgi:hypothetical protein